MPFLFGATCQVGGQGGDRQRHHGGLHVWHRRKEGHHVLAAHGRTQDEEQDQRPGSFDRAVQTKCHGERESEGASLQLQADARAILVECRRNQSARKERPDEGADQG